MDLEIIAQHINLRDVLTKDCGMTYCESAVRDYRIECPNPFHVDKNPSCFLSKDKLIFQCFGCGEKGTLVDIVRRNMDMKHDEAIDFVERLAAIPRDGTATKTKGRFVRKTRPEFQLSALYSRDWRHADKEILDFIDRRNFNRLLFDEWFIGYNNYLCSITVPIIEGTRIVNIGERFVFPSSSAEKFKYQFGGQIELDIWGVMEGYDQDDPYFTEGVWDALRLREAGYNAYALLNNRLYAAKAKRIRAMFPGKKWTIVPDPDEGGEFMINDWKTMTHYGHVDIVSVKGYNDIDCVPVKEINGMVLKNTTSLLEYIATKQNNAEELCTTITKRS